METQGRPDGSGDAAAPLRRLLLAENDGPLRELLAAELRGLSFNVVELSDGTALHDRLLTAATSRLPMLPDVVVAETALPGCSGLEICRQLLEWGASVPFILLSPTGLATDHDAAIRAGAAAVIDKPFSFNALAAAISDAARSAGPPTTNGALAFGELLA